MGTTTVQDSKNTAIVEGEMNVEGDVNIGDTTIITAKPVFSDVNLEAYENNEYVSPNFTGQLVMKFANTANRLMVISGFYGFDKTTFCKHLALKLVEDINRDGTDIKVKECQITSDFYGISSAINEFEENGIFILNNIKPKDVNHNLDELKRVANNHRNKIFIILNTDVPISSWKTTNPDYWYIIEQDGLFHNGSLLIPLIYKKTPLLKYVLNACEIRQLFTYKEKLKEVLSKAINTEIYTPEQLDIFLDVFEKTPSSEEKKIWEIIRKAKRKDKLINQWFLSLPITSKLTVIGMTMLDGIYEEQFFTIMDKFNHQVWSPFNDELRSLDFVDLHTLLHFFHFTEGETPNLQSKFPNQRFLTLSVLWKDYQRRIIAALPVLIELVIASVGKVYSSWELFGSRDKRVRLREVISEVLSDIGRISPNAVEHALLQLASHDDIGVQIVASKALARWREPFEEKGASSKLINKEKELFALLNQWLEDSRFLALVETIREMMEVGKGKGINSSSAYIRSTIILTLGYASLYDAPNALIEEIPNLLKNLIRDRHKLVIQRLRRSLRIILRNHPKQIGQMLFNLGKGEEDVIFKLNNSSLEHYVYAIAYGLADAHNDFPNDVEFLIEEWLSYCRVTKIKDSELDQLNYREHILSTVILLLGLIDYQKTTSYHLDEAIKELEILRKNEHSLNIRFLLLEVILLLNEKYYEEIKSVSSRVIPNIDSKERKRVVKNFRKRYLKQRSEQRGGDYQDIKLKGYKIESWIDKNERPFTDVEALIQKWLDSNNESLIGIACQTLMEFTKLEAIEEEKVETILQEQEEERIKIEETASPKRKYDFGLKARLIDKIFLRDETAKTIITLYKTEGNINKREIELIANKLEALGKKKSADALNSFYVKYLT